LFNGDTYNKLRVIGTSSGTYSLYIDRTVNGVTTVVSAVNIPTNSGTIHEYSLDWSKIVQGDSGVTVKIDETGDGIFERSFKTGATVQSQNFNESGDKITVCHVPGGDISKSNMIIVGRSALKAHLAHGDTEGPCPASTTSKLNKVEKSKNQPANKTK
jgi:hypothetical protein